MSLRTFGSGGELADTGVSKNTVAKLLEDAGEAFLAYHDRHVRGIAAKRVQCDEIWSFAGCKQKNVATAKRKDLTYGDVCTWVAMAADTKLAISYLVGDRDAEYASVHGRSTPSE